MALSALAVVAAVAAGCARSSSSGGGSTTSAPAATSTIAAPSGTQPVPVTVQTGSNGLFYLTVEVAVGGGQAVPVLLDTGSGGLIIESSAVGSSTTSTGASFTQSYDSGNATTELVQAPVTIGSLSTPSPIAVGVVQGAASSSILPSGVKGILGIDSTLHTTSGVNLYSPLLQMGGALASGFTITMASSSSAALVVGPVTSTSGATVLALSAASPSTYPTGAAAYLKYVNLCWTVGSASSCQPTTLDTGGQTPVAPVSGAPQQGDQVAPGTSVTIAAPAGGATLSQFTAASQGPTAVEVTAPSSSDPSGNSGNQFFIGKQIGFDYAGGRVLVSSASAS